MVMTYIELIGLYFPNVQCYVQGADDVYESIIWQSGDPLPAKQQLDVMRVNVHKETHIEALSTACHEDIIRGFVSSALGTPHVYDSKEVDQLNLVGSVAATSPNSMNDMHPGTIHYACRDAVTLAKSYKLHTYDQLRQVLADGAVIKLQKLQQFSVKAELVQAAATHEEIAAITWTSVP